MLTDNIKIPGLTKLPELLLEYSETNKIITVDINAADMVCQWIARSTPFDFFNDLRQIANINQQGLDGDARMLYHELLMNSKTNYETQNPLNNQEE